MIKNVILFLVLLIVAFAVILFVIANNAPSTLDVFFAQLTLPLGAICILFLAIGMLLGILLGGSLFQVAKLNIKSQQKKAAA